MVDGGRITVRFNTSVIVSFCESWLCKLSFGDEPQDVPLHAFFGVEFTARVYRRTMSSTALYISCYELWETISMNQ